MQITRTGLLAAALMGGLTLTACGHPSDVSMEKRFVTHESDFNQLLAMSKEDLRVARIPAENRNDVMKPAALTEQRWENYRSRFQKTGLSGGIDRSPDYPGATFVIASYSGIGIKGYAFSDVPLSPLVASWMATYRQTWDRRHTGYLHSDTSKQIGISTTMNEPGDYLRRSSKVETDCSILPLPYGPKPKCLRFLQLAACAALYISLESCRV